MLSAFSLAALLALTGSASAADGAPADPAALRVSVLDLLSGYEDAPTASELQLLGDGAGAMLLEIAGDSSVSRARRASATWALGYFPTEGSRAYLNALVSNSSADPQLRRSATWALCNGWGDAALDAVKPALGASDAQLRNQAVRAVSRVGTPAARSLLEARLPEEGNAMVRDAITASLSGELK